MPLIRAREKKEREDRGWLVGEREREQQQQQSGSFVSVVAFRKAGWCIKRERIGEL
jgi:hypothetical protein